jgi:orotate phosphoribosyltransferase
MVTSSKSREIAKTLLDIKAIFLRPDDMFTWASGIKSPIYCDNRVTLSYPQARTLIKSAFVDLIKAKYPIAEYVAGVATAGIPHAALIADALGLPMVYVRSSSKEHGRTNQIEGSIPVGSKAVVIEDLISTGGSSLSAVKALQESGVEVLGMVAIFTYGLKKAQENFSQAGISLDTLSDYNTLIEIALENKQISLEHVKILEDWQKNL